MRRATEREQMQQRGSITASPAQGNSWASPTPSPGAPGQAPSCVLGASSVLGLEPGSAGRRGLLIRAATSRLGDVVSHHPATTGDATSRSASKQSNHSDMASGGLMQLTLRRACDGSLAANRRGLPSHPVAQANHSAPQHHSVARAAPKNHCKQFLPTLDLCQIRAQARMTA